MTGTIYLYAELHLPGTAADAWRAGVLLDQERRLETVRGYDSLDMGDHDLLGGVIQVRGQHTLDGGLQYLRHVGLEVSAGDVTQSEVTEVDGEPWLRIVTGGALPRDATVGQLLDLLVAGDEFVELTATPDTAPAGPAVTVVLRGVLDGYDAFREHRLPLLYAAAAAGALGGTGRLSFIGDTDDEFVALLIDIDGPATSIAEPDPQNLTEEDWQDRLGDFDLTAARHAAWLAGRTGE